MKIPILGNHKNRENDARKKKDELIELMNQAGFTDMQSKVILNMFDLNTRLILEATVDLIAQMGAKIQASLLIPGKENN